MTKLLMMACGCVGMVRHNDAHDGLPEGHASCFTHIGNHPGACSVVEAPNLTGRRARCDYYGKPTRRNECNGYGGSRCGQTCMHEVDASTDLPFFVSEPGKPFDRFYCGCHSWD